ncbi:MAG: hypothetical protein QM674_12050 [Burkholderiaceae bacterium]
MSHPRRNGPRRQQGITLVVALITVVAMSLAALAMYRSVDVATLQSGNVARLTDQANKADLCVRRAITWMTDGSIDLQSGASNAARNYYGVQFAPNEMDGRYNLNSRLVSSTDNGWMGAAPDIDAGEGVRVNCVIERACSRAEVAEASHCQMAGGALGGQGKDGTKEIGVGALPVFRVSTRVDSDKGVSFSQVTLGPRIN